jgi:hypothetical protein
LSIVRQIVIRKKKQIWFTVNFFTSNTFVFIKILNKSFAIGVVKIWSYLWYIQKSVYAHFLTCIPYRTYEIDYCSLFLSFHWFALNRIICLFVFDNLYSPVANYFDACLMKTAKKKVNLRNSFQNEGLSPSCIALSFNRFGSISRTFFFFALMQFSQLFFWFPTFSAWVPLKRRKLSKSEPDASKLVSYKFYIDIWYIKQLKLIRLKR